MRSGRKESFEIRKTRSGERKEGRKDINKNVREGRRMTKSGRKG